MTIKVAINGYGRIGRNGRISRNELRATIHPYTSGQVLTDTGLEDLRWARSTNRSALR